MLLVKEGLGVGEGVCGGYGVIIDMNDPQGSHSQILMTGGVPTEVHSLYPKKSLAT